MLKISKVLLLASYFLLALIQNFPDHLTDFRSDRLLSRRARQCIHRTDPAADLHTCTTAVEFGGRLNPDKTTATKPIKKNIEVQERKWVDRNYFLPIKLDEMNKNSKLI